MVGLVACRLHYVMKTGCGDHAVVSTHEMAFSAKPLLLKK